jgi:hypothetical protein
MARKKPRIKLVLKRLTRARSRQLSRAEARAIFARHARKHFKVKDGQEWLVRYIQGQYAADKDHTRLIHQVLMLPFAL